MENFRMDNTGGYTQQQLDELNKELQERIESSGVVLGSSEYEELIKNFNDEVARR